MDSCWAVVGVTLRQYFRGTEIREVHKVVIHYPLFYCEHVTELSTADLLGIKVMEIRRLGETTHRSGRPEVRPRRRRRDSLLCTHKLLSMLKPGRLWRADDEDTRDGAVCNFHTSNPQRVPLRSVRLLRCVKTSKHTGRTLRLQQLSSSGPAWSLPHCRLTLSYAFLPRELNCGSRHSLL